MTQLNSDLFSLIQGLSSHEKSYYKKLAKRHAAQNHALHLQLFDLVDRNPKADEQKMMQQLGLSNQTQLSSLKQYLSKDVLDALIFLRRNDDTRIQLQFMLSQLNLLVEKKLLQLARRVYKKAWEMAARFEQTELQLQLLQLQSRMLESRSYKAFKTEAAGIRDATIDLLQHQHQRQQISFIFDQLEQLRKDTSLRLSSGQQQEVAGLRQALEAMQQGPGPDAFTSLLLHNALALSCYLMIDNGSCRRHTAHLLAGWQAQPHLINVYADIFISSAHTTFYNDFALKQPEAAALHLKQYNLLAEKNLPTEHFRNLWRVICFNARLKILHKQGQYEEVGRLIDSEAAAVLRIAAQVMPAADQLSVMSSVCITYFVLEQWDQAEDLLHDIKSVNRQTEREDIFYFSIIFHLCILYEKKDLYRLDSAIEAAYHLLYARNKQRPFEKELMLFLKRLLSARSHSAEQEQIRLFLKKLDDFKNDPAGSMYFLYFNFYTWLESKMLKQSYMHFMQSRLHAPGPAASGESL